MIKEIDDFLVKVTTLPDEQIKDSYDWVAQHSPSFDTALDEAMANGYDLRTLYERCQQWLPRAQKRNAGKHRTFIAALELGLRIKRRAAVTN